MRLYTAAAAVCAQQHTHRSSCLARCWVGSDAIHCTRVGVGCGCGCGCGCGGRQGCTEQQSGSQSGSSPRRVLRRRRSGGSTARRRWRGASAWSTGAAWGRAVGLAALPRVAGACPLDAAVTPRYRCRYRRSQSLSGAPKHVAAPKSRRHCGVGQPPHAGAAPWDSRTSGHRRWAGGGRFGRSTLKGTGHSLLR